MKTRALLLLALVMMLLGVPVALHASSATPTSELRVEWEQIARGNRTVVRGYVYNTYQMRAENVLLRVEQLDASAQPVVTRTVFVIGTIPYRDRGYFEVAMPAAGAAYRVCVQSFDRAGCGNG